MAGISAEKIWKTSNSTSCFAESSELERKRELNQKKGNELSDSASKFLEPVSLSLPVPKASSLSLKLDLSLALPKRPEATKIDVIGNMLSATSSKFPGVRGKFFRILVDAFTVELF